MRKSTSLFLALLLVFAMLGSTALAAGQNASLQLFVEVDGEQIEFQEHAPIAENGSTLVPAEPLFQALGITQEQGEEDVTIGTKGDWRVELQEGGTTATVNGESFELPVQPRVIDGVPYIPVRFVGEAAGYEVRWDHLSRTVVLASQDSLAGGRGFLWEVQNEGNTVYLLGSMHIADNSFYPLADAMEEAFASADYLGVEIDLTKAVDPEMQALMLEMGSYQDGTTLKDHLSEETYARLSEVLTANGLTVEALEQFKPWVVDSTLQVLQAASSGLQAEAGIDLYFSNKAIERQIPILELESYESQLAMFNSFSPELQEFMLSQTLENIGAIDDSALAMADMWKAGDEQALLELTEAFKENEEYYNAMLAERNNAMTEKVKGYLNGDEDAVYFIVVGAAHMIDESGIVTQLQNEGYTVTRK